MTRLLPRFNRCRWGGADLTGDLEVTGWSFGLQWLGLMVEIGVGSVR